MGFTEAITDPTRRDVVVATLQRVIDDEVATKSGLSGVVLKGAYGGVKALAEGTLQRAIGKMLPDFASALAPFWDARGDQSFGPYLASRGPEAADALLAVTDRRAEGSSNAALVRLYRSARGKAKGHVEAALPRLGEALERVAS